MAALMFSSALYAMDLDLKAGVMHPTSPNKFGLDTAVAFNYDLNKYFLVGAETGWGWVNWRGLGRANDYTNPHDMRPDLYPSRAANLYYIPILATATAHVEFTEVIPYLSGGLGYAWALYRGDYKDTYSKYTWQLLGGLKWKFQARTLLITEMGFRSAATKSGRDVLDMTGWMGRVGICIPFGKSSGAASGNAAKQ